MTTRVNSRPPKPLGWLGSSYRDLMALPAQVRQHFGYALRCAQEGERHESAKPLRGFGNAGVLEIVKDHAGGTWRAVYTVNFAEAVFVLHVFQKKSRHGIETPREEMALVRQRLSLAAAIAQDA
jgi:phage-related protein